MGTEYQKRWCETDEASPLRRLPELRRRSRAMNSWPKWISGFSAWRRRLTSMTMRSASATPTMRTSSLCLAPFSAIDRRQRIDRRLQVQSFVHVRKIIEGVDRPQLVQGALPFHDRTPDDHFARDVRREPLHEAFCDAVVAAPRTFARGPEVKLFKFASSEKKTTSIVVPTSCTSSS